MVKAKLLPAIGLLVLSGCTHSIHLVHSSDFSPYVSAERGQLVRAEAEQFTIMGVVDNTNYVDQAYVRLQEQCQNGYLTGITTQLSTSHGFFSWTNKVLMQGLCVTKKTAS